MSSESKRSMSRGPMERLVGVVGRFGCLVLLLLSLPGGRALGAPGDIDTAFADNGRLLLYSYSNMFQSVDDAVLLDSEEVVVIGNDDDFLGDWGTNLELARIRTDGTVIEPSIFVDSGGFDDGASRAIVAADGKLVIVGSTCCRPGGNNLAVYRLDRDPRQDQEFGSNGVVLVDLGGDEEATAVAEGADGSLIVAGRASAHGAAGYWVGEPRGLALIRLLADGTHDPTFRDGQLLFPGEDVRAVALLGLSSGKLLLATNHFDGVTNLGCRLTQLSEDGRVDADFAGDGIVTLVDPVRGPVQCNDMAQRDDGGFVVAGSAWSRRDCAAPTCSSAVAASVSPDGALETAFNGGFAALPDMGKWNALNRIRLDSTGKIVALGVARRTPRQNECFIDDVMVLRIGSDGRPDQAFGAGGTSVLGQREQRAPTWPDARPNALVLDSDDRILVAAAEPNRTSLDRYTYGGNSFATVMRLLADGAGPGIIEFDECPRAHEESTVTIDVVARRVGGSAGSATVAYRTVEGSAIAGSDFDVASGVLEWADGDTSVRKIQIRLLDDQEPEPEKFFWLRLSDVSGATLGGGLLRVSIRANDGWELPSGTASPPSTVIAPAPAPSGGGGGGATSPVTLFAFLLLAMAVPALGKTTRSMALAGEHPLRRPGT